MTDVFYKAIYVLHARVHTHTRTDLVSFGSTETLGPWNTDWSSLSFVSLLRDMRILKRKVLLQMSSNLKKCKEATYSLADYSLWPNFSPLASVTLQKSGKMSMPS